MRQMNRGLFTVSTALMVTFAAPAAVPAAPIQLFSAAELSSGDVLFQYPARSIANTQPVVLSPFVLAGPGNVLTFTEAGSAFVRMDQEPSTPTGGGWFGTFAAGTRLLYTGNAADSHWFGPIAIDFAIPILEFGLLAQFNDEFFSGPFFFTVFSGPTALATFNRGVTALPSFLGARAEDSMPFTSIQIRGPSSLPGDNDFAIGPVTLSQVPEPATLVLLASGLVGIGVQRRRRRLTISPL